jgi:hypothetical protein
MTFCACGLQFVTVTIYGALVAPTCLRGEVESIDRCLLNGIHQQRHDLRAGWIAIDERESVGMALPQ